MLVTFDFQNGMSIVLKPENIQVADNGGKETVLVTRTDKAIVPLLFFPALLATPDELKARADKAKAVADAPQATVASAPPAPAVL